jgi:hypothetical protein
MSLATDPRIVRTRPRLSAAEWRAECLPKIALPDISRALLYALSTSQASADHGGRPAALRDRAVLSVRTTDRSLPAATESAILQVAYAPRSLAHHDFLSPQPARHDSLRRKG